MIRAKLDRERMAEYAQAVSMGATTENLDETLKRIRTQNSLR